MDNTYQQATVEQLKAAAREWQALQARSFKMRDTRGAGKAQRELEKIWRELDRRGA